MIRECFVEDKNVLKLRREDNRTLWWTGWMLLNRDLKILIVFCEFYLNKNLCKMRIKSSQSYVWKLKFLV